MILKVERLSLGNNVPVSITMWFKNHSSERVVKSVRIKESAFVPELSSEK